MGLFGLLGGADIDQGVEEWKKTPGAVLLDVRSPGEYRQGHIPGSVNVPVNEIGQISEQVPQKETPLFVYCLSGSRSSRAVRLLKQQGYTEVNNIGGINGYQGKVEV